MNQKFQFDAYNLTDWMWVVITLILVWWGGDIIDWMSRRIISLFNHREKNL